MQLIQGIAQGAPLWVWPVLIFLAVIGLKATRDRRMPRTLFYALPFLGLITLRSISTLPPLGLIWLGFVAGGLIGALLGHALHGQWLIGREGRTLLLRGEWFTFTMLMVIFWSNFISGTVKAISPAFYESTPFLLGVVLLCGFAAGSFLGRSVRALTTPA